MPKKVKDEVVIFANTLWFIINFKKSLIDELLKKGYLVKVIYLRIGPVLNLEDEFIKKDNLLVITFIDFCLNILKKKSYQLGIIVGEYFWRLLYHRLYYLLYPYFMDSRNTRH